MKRRSKTLRRAPLKSGFIRMVMAMVFVMAQGVGFGSLLPIAQAQEPTGSVAISSEPAGARVIVNGRRMGVTPFDISMAGGSELAVSVEMDGYSTFTTTVTIKSGDVEKIHAVLETTPTEATNTPAPQTE